MAKRLSLVEHGLPSRLPLIFGYRAYPGTPGNRLPITPGSGLDAAVAAIKGVSDHFLLSDYDEMDVLPRGVLGGVLCRLDGRPELTEGEVLWSFTPLQRVKLKPGGILRAGYRTAKWEPVHDLAVEPGAIEEVAAKLRSELIRLAELDSQDPEAEHWLQAAEIRTPEVMLARAANAVDLNTKDYHSFILSTNLGERLALVYEYYHGLLLENPASDIQRYLASHKLAPEIDKAIRHQLASLQNVDLSPNDRGPILENLRVLISVPWESPPSKPPLTPEAARRVLDASHSGAEELKQAILDQVYTLNWLEGKSGEAIAGANAPLLLVGPPGIGKTAILADAEEVFQRPLEIISCSAITDPQFLVGSQKMWVGSQLGAIMQSSIKAGTGRYILAFDELDKFPATSQQRDALLSVLMQVIDPIRSRSFVDQHLGQSFDLSEVIVIATANDTSKFPAALLDRFRVVEMRGYSPLEKLTIVSDYSLPRLRDAKQISGEQLVIPKETIRLLIDDYDSESGVRELNRFCETILARSLRDIMSGAESVVVDAERLETYLGTPRKDLSLAISRHVLPGTGDALSVAGDGTGYVEHVTVTLVPVPDGKTVITGSVKKEYRETIVRVRDYVVAREQSLGLKKGEAEVLLTNHLHVAHDGIGTPVEGPSAGVSLTLAMLSYLYKEVWPDDLVATGALEFHGKVSAIGQLPEKLIAAARHGKKRVIIPKGNLRDLKKVAPDTLAALTILAVDSIEEAVDIAFPGRRHRMVSPTPTKEGKAKVILAEPVDTSWELAPAGIVAN